MSRCIRKQPGRSGQKWVGLNYKEKESAKGANGGVMPYTLSLVTSDFPHKAEWSQIDLPDILFHIQPPISEYEGVKVEDLIENGEPVVSDAPDRHKIRHFEILPRHISIDAPGWLVEAWRRLDTRIGYQDILDRQYADPSLGLKKLTKNALQNHCRRECRKVLNTWVEYGRRNEPHRTEVESIEGLSYENITFNTTLKRSLIFSNRLVKVRLERKVEDGLYYAIPLEVTIENWRETTLPLGHFLPDGPPMDMTPEMHAAWEMYLILTERAAVHGYEHWSKLDRSCLPVSWYDRTRTKSVPNDTYDGGCDICTWSLDREILSSPDIKLEPDEPSLTTKARKRRRSGSRAELWDLGDTPKAPKRRYTTRLSSQGRASGPRGTNCDSSLAIRGVIYEETYLRGPGKSDYYSVEPFGKVLDYGEGDFSNDSEDESLSDEDAGDEGSSYERGGDEQREQNVVTPPSCSKSDPLSPDDEEATGTVRNVEADSLFRTPSAERAKRHVNYRQVESATGSLYSPMQNSSQAGSWLRRSNFLQSDSLVEDFDHNPSSPSQVTTLLPCDLDDIPGYLPASAFPNRRSSYVAVSTQETGPRSLPYESSFTSVTTKPGASFSSNDASISMAASSFTEASPTAISHYYALPNPTTSEFLAAQFYPLLMTQSHAAVNSSSYPSPPQTATYQNQTSFMSSPLRRSESEWEWTQNRPRRHSDTDAAFGLPDDFAELGAFAYDLSAVSSYLGDQEFVGAPELPPIAASDEFANSHSLEGDVSEDGENAVQGNAVKNAANGRVIQSNFNNGFLGDEANVAPAPLSVLHVCRLPHTMALQSNPKPT